MIIFLPISLKIFLCDQKNNLDETVLLSTHNICFGLEFKIIFFNYALLSGGLRYILQTAENSVGPDQLASEEAS